jgi:hypothetical protein
MVYRPLPDGRYDEGELRETVHDWSPIESRVLEGFVVEPEELFAELD